MGEKSENIRFPGFHSFLSEKWKLWKLILPIAAQKACTPVVYRWYTIPLIFINLIILTKAYFMESNILFEDKAMSGGKTTITFRILPDIKLELAKKARSLGMSPAQYVEALVVKGHFEANQETKSSQEQKPFQLSETSMPLFQHFIQKLKARFPEQSNSDLVISCLAHGVENSGALWQRSLSTFLKRVLNGYYQTKTKNHDN